MAQPKIQRYAIHWTDSAFKYSRGKWVLWADVAPYIKEARPTVRAKRPVQQAKYAICPKCKRRFRYKQVFCPECCDS